MNEKQIDDITKHILQINEDKDDSDTLDATEGPEDDAPEEKKDNYIEGGRADGMEDDEFDKEALDKGTEVELEHTEDEGIAKDIAKDHLAEFDTYYDALAEMEAELKEEEDGDKEDKEKPTEDEADEECHLDKEGELGESKKNESKVNESTRAVVGIDQGEEGIHSIYIHFDGMPGKTGKALKALSVEDVERLIDLGDRRTLHPDEDVKSSKALYGEEKEISKDITAFVEHANEQGASYTYLFKDGKWLVRKSGGGEFRPLVVSESKVNEIKCPKCGEEFDYEDEEEDSAWKNILQQAKEIYDDMGKGDWKAVVDSLLDNKTNREWFENKFYGNEFDLRQELEDELSEEELEESKKVNEENYEPNHKLRIHCKSCGKKITPVEEEDNEKTCIDCLDKEVKEVKDAPQCKNCNHVVNQQTIKKYAGFCGPCYDMLGKEKNVSKKEACKKCKVEFKEEDMKDGYCHSCGKDEGVNERKVNEEHTKVKDINYKGHVITISATSPTRFGTLYSVSNDIGEPYLEDKAYESEAEAEEVGKKDVDAYVNEFKLTEVKFMFDNHQFTVVLSEDNQETGTTISINNKQKFNFTPEFSSMYRNDKGKITDEGLKELAQSALSNVSEEFFDQLVVKESNDMDESKKDKDMKKKEQIILKTAVAYYYVREYGRFERTSRKGKLPISKIQFLADKGIDDNEWPEEEVEWGGKLHKILDELAGWFDYDVKNVKKALNSVKAGKSYAFSAEESDLGIASTPEKAKAVCLALDTGDEEEDDNMDESKKDKESDESKKKDIDMKENKKVNEGWDFEYLGQELIDQVVDKLEKLGIDKEYRHSIDFDHTTSLRLEYGDDRPEVGVFDGTITNAYDHVYTIKYKIKRRRPADGLDYSDYEAQYECILLSLIPGKKEEESINNKESDESKKKDIDMKENKKIKEAYLDTEQYRKIKEIIKDWIGTDEFQKAPSEIAVNQVIWALVKAGPEATELLNSMIDAEVEDEDKKVLLDDTSDIKASDDYNPADEDDKEINAQHDDEIDDDEKQNESVIPDDKDNDETKIKKLTETRSLEINFKDLSDEGQKKVLDFYGLESSEDGNLDISPLVILDVEDEEVVESKKDKNKKKKLRQSQKKSMKVKESEEIVTDEIKQQDNIFKMMTDHFNK